MEALIDFLALFHIACSVSKRSLGRRAQPQSCPNIHGSFRMTLKEGCYYQFGIFIEDTTENFAGKIVLVSTMQSQELLSHC